MYDKIFRRVEMKYILSEKEKEMFLKCISPYVEKDVYYQSTINNIYFDTQNDDFIIHSISKPNFKEKIRVRSYNTPTLKSPVFLEIKNKYKGIVGKRRASISLEEFYDFLNRGIYDSKNQILKEIDYQIHLYDLYPKIVISYDRKSYRGVDDNNLRITIDENLRSRREDLRLEIGSQGNYYFDDSSYIMEIKALGSIPIWLVKILSELRIYPSGFSKYGRIYMKECGVKC